MNMLKKLLANGTPTTAAEIAKALETTRAERAAAASELAMLADRRAEALISGTDAAVDRIETEQTAAARKLDRLDATLARLEVRLAEAERAEVAAAIEKQATEAQQAVDQLAGLYGEIDVATNELRQLFDRAAPLAAKVDAWNRQGHQLGRPRLMFSPIDTIRERTIGSIRR